MATNENLTKGWITFLKAAQIAAPQSNPDGTLNYKRTPTVEDFTRFLKSETHFTDEQIESAIGKVVGAPTTQPATPTPPTPPGLPPPPAPPGAPTPPTPPGSPKPSAPTPPGAPTPPTSPGKPKPGAPTPPGKPGSALPGASSTRSSASNKIPHDPSSITDIAYRDIPNEPQNNRNLSPTQSRQKSGQQSGTNSQNQTRISRWKFPKLKEAIVDPTTGLDERSVEEIIAALGGTSEKSKGQAALDDLKQATTPSPKTKEEKKYEVDKIKDTIKNKMTDSQRKSLWRLLKNA